MSKRDRHITVRSPPRVCYVAIATSEEPHPNPPQDTGEGTGSKANHSRVRYVALVASEEPHPNPPLAKGRGPEVLLNVRPIP